MTLRLITPSITIHVTMAHSMKVSMATLNIRDAEYDNSQLNVILNVIAMLSVIITVGILSFRMLSVIITVVILSFRMLSVIITVVILSFRMLSVIVLSLIILSTVMLSAFEMVFKVFLC
jgi:hypothetical protein